MEGSATALSKAKAIEKQGVEARIPTPALFELWRGVHLASRTAEEATRVSALLASYPSAVLDASAAALAGEVDARMIRQGQTIDPEDSMIAGIALARGEAILTRNIRHFSRVAGLQVEAY